MLLHDFCIEQSELFHGDARGKTTESNEDMHRKEWARIFSAVFVEIERQLAGTVTIRKNSREVSVLRR